MKEIILKRARTFIIMVVALLSLTLPSHLLAYDFEVDGIYYYLVDGSSFDRECAVASSSNKYSGSVVIPETVKYDGIDYLVTSIGNEAFKGCTGLTEVTIPNSVTRIYENAFSGCTGLTEVTIPNSVKRMDPSTFYGCTGLKNVSIGNSVTWISEYAFSGCTGLTEVTIPNSVTWIYENAFSGCTGLTEVTIPNSVTWIYENAFSGCTGLTEVTIPNSVTEIGRDAFSECTGLTRVDISDIAAWCGISFRNDSSNPLIFAHHLYINDKEIVSLVIPDSVTEIGYMAFAGCSGLTQVNIPNSVTEIGVDAFYGCSGLTQVTIPNSVTSIGYYAFCGCTGLTEVTIPNSVTEIGSEAFSTCTSLTEITIGNSVTEIGDYAFYDCTGLTQVTIPNSVKSIGGSAFKNCSSLELIECLAPTPPTITSTSFPNYKVRLFAANDSYKTADIWSNFTNIAYPYNPGEMTFEVDGLYYEVTSDKTCCLYAIDENVVGEELIIPETVEYSGSQLTPNEIKSGAIYNSGKIESITIPSWITTLKVGAIFKSKIEKIHLTTDITQNFLWGSTINELVISPSVSNISARLTTNNINKITIEDSNNSLTAVNLECKAKEVYIGRNVSSSTFKDMTSLDAVTISDNVTKLDSYLFYGCKGLTEVIIPNSVILIDQYVFYNCSGLASVSIGNSVISIGEDAFQFCSNLTTLNIPNSVKSIGDYAFCGCGSLTTLDIPNSVKSIGDSAFMNCSGVTTLNIPNSVTSISRQAFANCSSLTALDIPSTVTSINNYAFYECSSLTTLIIPNTVTSIGEGAFEHLDGLISLKIEDGEKYLSLNPFRPITSKSLTEAYFGRSMKFSNISSFSALKTVEFGKNVKTIEDGSFKGSDNIRTVISNNTVPQTASDDTFSYNTYLEGVLYVPESSINDYAAASCWENFWTIKSLDEFNGVNDVYNDDDTTFSVSDGALHVVGDAPVRVVAINGTVAYSGRGNQDINLNKGMYIVVIGNKASKIVVK